MYRILILILLLQNRLGKTDFMSYEKMIINQIFNVSQYNKVFRPNDTVYINLTLSLRQIVSLDEIKKLVVTSSYLFIDWYDPRLSWDDSTYQLDYISLPAKNIWLPDLFILNAGDSNGFIQITDSNLAYAVSNGRVCMSLGLIGKFRYKITLV